MTAKRFVRGFKAKAERIACEMRREVGLNEHDPLRAKRLARHLEVPTLAMQRLPGLPAEVVTLLERDSGIHGLTIPPSNRVLYNAANSPGRCQSDLMHELAHLLLGHRPTSLIAFAGTLFRSEYDEATEAEAEWLGGCLQLPRPCLVWAVSRRMSNEQIAALYTASVEMVRFRRNATGVDRMFGQ